MTPVPPDDPCSSSRSQATQHSQEAASSSQTSRDTALVLGLLQALGFPEPELDAPGPPGPAPDSAPLSSTSSTSSASHVAAAGAARRASSTTSSSSSDSDSDIGDKYLSSSFSTTSGTTTAAAASEAPDSNTVTMLDVDGLLPDSDLDALLKRLTAAKLAAGAGPSTGISSVPVHRQPARQSSSELSSDKSSSSLTGDAQGAEPCSPPATSTSYGSYEPRWLKQQRQRQQEQDCAGSRSSSYAGCSAHPVHRQQCADKVWVPEPPSTVLDLRVSAASAGPVAAQARGDVSRSTATCTVPTDKSAERLQAAGRSAWEADSGSDSASSEEEWQQFRQRQRSGAGMAAAVTGVHA
jgi:hypothetical protein